MVGGPRCSKRRERRLPSPAGAREGLERRSALGRQPELSALHHGQSIDAAGNIEGRLPETDTLGFRWSAVHNLFLTAGDLVADEWRAGRAVDEENAGKEMRQFVWCLPSIPPCKRGYIPPGCQWVTAAIDLGKYLAHWIVVAWEPGARGYVVDYGRIEIASDDLGIEQAILVGLRQFSSLVQAGWQTLDGERQPRSAQQVWIDSGYMPEIVYTFCRGQHLPAGRRPRLPPSKSGSTTTAPRAQAPWSSTLARATTSTGSPTNAFA